tara:strand:- start:854 stop:1960 length:1107 start_codon:yes stop_codon:yes gene_type:complete
MSKLKIVDTNRIDKVIPTLKYLLNKRAKIIIISHLGRPKGRKVNDLSLKPICENLSLQLNQEVKLIDKDLNKLKKEELSDNYQNQVLVLENIRFYKEEELNSSSFAKKIASLGDFYINEAFSCSHRSHASISEITKNIDSFAGLLFVKEINALKKITSEISNPITCIIGGSKISSKIQIIENLIPKFDNIIILGGMANNFLKYKKINIGKSIFEKNSENIVKKLLNLSKKSNCNLYFPEDVNTGKHFNDKSTVKKVTELEDDDIILDIGEKTISKVISIINSSKTILWNGPAGYFENPNFAKGSFEIAKKIAKNTSEGKLYSVLGGGDTVSVINKINLFESYNFVSTAGGAFLEYLEGKELPGIKALN